MLTGPPNFRDPRVLGMAISLAANPRAAAIAARIVRQEAAPPKPAPIPLKRTMGEMIADLEARQQRLEQQQQRTPMPAQIVSLADALKGAQDALPRAVAAAHKLTANVIDLVDAVGQVETLSAQVAMHTAGVRALLGGISNGGPPLDPQAPTPAAP